MILLFILYICTLTSISYIVFQFKKVNLLKVCKLDINNKSIDIIL